jgi:arylformamidase
MTVHQTVGAYDNLCQSRDFAAAVKAVGKPVQLVQGMNYTHSAMCESIGHPHGPNGRAALAMMKLAPS